MITVDVPLVVVALATHGCAAVAGAMLLVVVSIIMNRKKK